MSAALGQAVLQSSGDDIIVLVVFFLVGLLLIYHGFRKWQRMRLIQDTPTEPVRSAAAGRTEVTGTGTPIDGVGPRERPFTDGECLVATYEIEEWDDDSDDDGGNWTTLDSGTLLTPFHLDDGTGVMRVEPTADGTFEISEENRTRIRVGSGQTPPSEVAEFIRRRNDDDDGFLGMGLNDIDLRGSDRRRYTQEVIPPETSLYLLGGASPTSEGTPSLTLGTDGASDEFIISDRTEESLVSNYRWAAPLEMVGGLVLSTAMLYLLLA